MRHVIGIVVYHLCHELTTFVPSECPELHEQPGVLRTATRRVRWRRGGRQVVWS